MQIRPQSWLYLAAFAVLGSGCASTTSTDEDARSARLPTGVTLLDSDRNECSGSVAIDERSVANARRADLVIQRGQNAVFQIDADDNDDVEIDWTCVGAANTDRNTVECPDETEYVRITRATTGNDFLLECYGDRDNDRDRRVSRR
ncbi:MAG TPA: hypothetical protein VM692_05685 [Gammaproteobacteria bacterium]|nr:hypothetical protein [Gammaproteobacteria bacterium]